MTVSRARRPRARSESLARFYSGQKAGREALSALFIGWPRPSPQAGANAIRRILGIGAVSGHHEHRSPSTNVATDARGWRSTLRRSIARLVPQPGQNTSSHGRSSDQGGPDRGRPQHVTAGGQLLIPALDDGLRLGARGGVGNLPLGIDGNVQAPRPHAHGAVLPGSGGATTCATTRVISAAPWPVDVPAPRGSPIQ